MRENLVWQEKIASLWPGASVTPVTRRSRRRGRARGGEAGFREFAFLPDATNPRLLLPASTPAAAATALRRYSHALGLTERAGRGMLATAVRSGLPQRRLIDRLRVSAPATTSIEDYLSQVLGQDVVVSVHLGNPRINRKPVLHALSPEGKSLAFVKVGDNDTTRQLVHDEAAALRSVGTRELRHITAPRVIHHGRWQGFDILVLSPLVTTVRRWKKRNALPIAGMTELAALDASRPARVPDTAFWEALGTPPPEYEDQDELTRVGGRTERLGNDKIARTFGPQPHPYWSAFCRTRDRIGERYGDVVLPMGPWHGDWTPWNMAWHGNSIQLWDWERYTEQSPVGFDSLHYRLQDAARSAGGLTPSVLTAWLADAPATLAPFGVTGRSASATAALYLVTLCQRYLPARLDHGTPQNSQAHTLWTFVTNNAGHL